MQPGNFLCGMDYEAKPRAQCEGVREATILGSPKPGQSYELGARNTDKGSFLSGLGHSLTMVKGILACISHVWL